MVAGSPCRQASRSNRSRGLARVQALLGSGPHLVCLAGGLARARAYIASASALSTSSLAAGARHVSLSRVGARAPAPSRPAAFRRAWAQRGFKGYTVI